MIGAHSSTRSHHHEGLSVCPHGGLLQTLDWFFENVKACDLSCWDDVERIAIARRAVAVNQGSPPGRSQTPPELQKASDDVIVKKLQEGLFNAGS
jgi:hypothetical protein